MLGLIKLNATGQKIGKKVTEAGNSTITDYLTGGFQYSNSFLQFFPHAEGYVTNVLTSTDCPTCRFKPFYSLNYVFNYTDHLGNVRLSYAQENGALKILEENSYYPFGLKHTRNNVNSKMFVETNGTTSLQTIGELTPYTTYFKNNYKYNGKELQDELGLNMYDYGARLYDPARAGWSNIDPLAEKMRRYSPYNYCFNNPLRFTDPDGMKPVDWYENKKTGNIQWYNGSAERKGYTNLGNSTNIVAGTGQALQLNSNGTATDMNSGKKYGPNKTIAIGETTVKTGTVIDKSEMFLNGLKNTAFGVVGAIGSGLYSIGTEGIGAAAGGATAFTLSCSEIGIGCSQMIDAYNLNPDTELHNYGTIPGLIAAKNGSEYAPLVDGVAGWIPGSLSGGPGLKMLTNGNAVSALEATRNVIKGENVIMNSASTIDAVLDGKGLIEGVKDAHKTYKQTK